MSFLSFYLSFVFILNKTFDKCLNKRNLHFCLLNELILNVIPATGLK